MSTDLDAKARLAARTVFDRPIVLEAGAGTGKTAMLVARVLFWCLSPGWEKARASLGEEATPEEIAVHILEHISAITFTDRAAAEMEERIGSAFAKLLDGKEVDALPREELQLPDEELRLRCRAFLSVIDRLSASTIHSFCRRILASHPVEAGLHPAFEVDSDFTELRNICRELVMEEIPALYGEPGDPDALTLAREGIGPTRLITALSDLAVRSVPAEALAQDPFSPELTAQVCRDFLEKVNNLAALIETPIDTSTSGRLARSRGMLETLKILRSGLLQVKSVEQLLTLVNESGAEGVETCLKEWGKGKTNNTESEILARVLDELPGAAAAVLVRLEDLGKVHPVIVPAGCRLLGRWLTEVYRRMRLAGLVTFNDLLRETRNLLRAKPDTAAFLRRSMDLLLVDEVQDTDPVQYEILEELALKGPVGKRPSLFLIGDPKQSIYGWRSADLAAYGAFLKKVKEDGGNVYPLAVNFRSVPEILDEVNRVISKIMVEEEGLQPPFEPLAPSGKTQSKNIPGDRRIVEYWVSWRRPGEHISPDIKTGPDTSTGDAYAIEARALAEDLVNLREQGEIEWNKVGLLLRKSTQFEPYLDALRDAGIPFIVEGDRNYYRRREVIDAGSMVRAVLDPNDQIALVAFLRSPVIGVPDAAWLPLWRGSFPEWMARLAGPDAELFGKLDACIDGAKSSLSVDIPGLDRIAHWDESLKAAVRGIGVLRHSFTSEPANLFVERARRIFLMEETESARYQGAHRLANLERFFRHLLDSLASHPEGTQGVLRELRAGIRDSEDAEEAAPGDEKLQAVRVLTVHKAKGLTFDYVYVLGLHAGKGNTYQEEALAMKNGKRWELYLWGWQTYDLGTAEERAAAVSAAEEVRNLYVAMTRPRYRLVLAGCWAKELSRPDPLERSEAVQLLEHRDGIPDLSGLFQKGEKGKPILQDDKNGVRWKFVDPGEAPAQSVHTSRATPPLSLKDARAEFEQLQKMRVEARARMGRSLMDRASEQGHATFDALRIDPVVKETALAVGKAVHSALEHFDFSADPAKELTRQQGLLGEYLKSLALPDEIHSGAVAGASEILSQLAASPLLPRLSSLNGKVIGREVPLFIGPGVTETAATGATVGTIDLLYREPDTGEWVVADYKTDRVSTPEEIAGRAATYRAQGKVYCEAIRRAFALKAPPRFELWFLRPGHVEVVETHN